MGKKGIETLVGLFVLLGIAGLVFLALKAANLGTFNSGDTYALLAKFDSIGGLKVRAPVRSAGVTVGRVASITLDPKTYQGVVRLQVERGVQFPADSSARILTSGLLGDQYVGIEAGADESRCARRRRSSQTQSAVVLESLIGQFLFNKAADAGSATAPPPRHRPVERNERVGLARQQCTACWSDRCCIACRDARRSRPGRTAPGQRLDPWENWNRKVFAFDEGLDEKLLIPVATFYSDLVSPGNSQRRRKLLRKHARCLVGGQQHAAGQVRRRIRRRHAGRAQHAFWIVRIRRRRVGNGA